MIDVEKNIDPFGVELEKIIAYLVIWDVKVHINFIELFLIKILQWTYAKNVIVNLRKELRFVLEET